jgi:DNA replication and repair protein RecF
VQIGAIQLLEFRNYRTLSYRPSPRLNLLTGLNAQGKTNLLEGLAVLVTGRSFRTSRLVEIARWGAGSVVVSGDLLRTDGARAVRRTITKLEDGTWQASGNICPWARVVVFGWQDLAILNGPPAARRNFIDGFAARLFASHLATLLQFRQVLARRNRLLQTRAPEIRLAPWDEQFASVGMELVGRRRRAVAALQTELARIYPSLVGGRPKVEVRYRASVGEATEPAALESALGKARAEEMRRGQTLVGPHRDDLAIELDGVDVRAFGSRGQQRLLALALRFAEVLPITEAAGTAPVLLLDDALSELDSGVREHALREMRAADQVFLTTPEPLVLRDAARWVVSNGTVREARPGVGAEVSAA